MYFRNNRLISLKCGLLIVLFFVLQLCSSNSQAPSNVEPVIIVDETEAENYFIGSLSQPSIETNYTTFPYSISLNIKKEIFNAHHYYLAYSLFKDHSYQVISPPIDFAVLGTDEYTFRDTLISYDFETYYKIYACTQDNYCVSSGGTQLLRADFLARSNSAGELVSHKQSVGIITALLQYGISDLNISLKDDSELAVNVLDNIFGCTIAEKEASSCSQEEDLDLFVPEFHHVTYNTTHNGETVEASGLVCLPRDKDANYLVDAPIYVAQHDTVLSNNDVPSSIGLFNTDTIAGVIKGIANRYLADHPIVETIDIKGVNILGCSVNIMVNINIDTIQAALTHDLDIIVNICPGHDISTFLDESITILLPAVTEAISKGIINSLGLSSEVKPLELTAESHGESAIRITGPINFLLFSPHFTAIFDDILTNIGLDVSIQDFLEALVDDKVEAKGVNELHFSDFISISFLEFYCFFGHILFMPDYIGYNTSDQLTHLLYDKVSSAHSVIDFILAAKEFLDEKSVQSNNDLYLIGYGEGAYISLLAQQQLQLDPDLLTNTSLNLKGASLGAGIYNIKNYIHKSFVNIRAYNMRELIFYVYGVYLQHLENRTLAHTLTPKRVALEDIFKPGIASLIENGLFDPSRRDSLYRGSNLLTDVFQQDFIDDVVNERGFLGTYLNRHALYNSISPFDTTIPIQFFYNLYDTTTGDISGVSSGTSIFNALLDFSSIECLAVEEIQLFGGILPINENLISYSTADIVSKTAIGFVLEDFLNVDLNVHTINNFGMLFMTNKILFDIRRKAKFSNC